MSASREKKKRFDERAGGTEKRQVRAREGKQNKKRSRIITTVAAVLVVVLLLTAVVFNSDLFYTGVAAVTIGDAKYTTADFNYEYYNTYYQTFSQFYEEYGDLAAYLLDPKKPLTEQYYSEGKTWDAYFEETALDQLQKMTILTNMARENGWSLSSEQLAQIDAEIERLKTEAIASGNSDYRAYLRSLFGKGITESRLRSLLEKSFYATYYSDYLGQQWISSYTEDELTAYYESKRDSYDPITYMYYYVSGAADEESGVDQTAAMAAAKTTAENIAAAHDTETFADAVYQYAPEDTKETYADADACLYRNVYPENMTNAEWKTWLTDRERTAGETIVFTTDNGYQVLQFVSRNDNHYAMASLRGITIPMQADPDTGEVTEEAKAAAKATADSILESYQADPTEENFAELADLYNTDQNLTGGLYEYVVMGQFTRQVEDFIFAADTQVGDVQLFEEDNALFLAYPMERGELYDLTLAKNLKAQEQFDALMDAARAQNPVEKKFAYRFIK